MGRQQSHHKQKTQSLTWTSTRQETVAQDEQSVVLCTNRGDIIARYHAATGVAARCGVVWVGGAGGGLDGPARGLYPAACRRLQQQGIAGLRLHYRLPNYLQECVLDTLLGVEFLVQEGVEQVAVVGHSFGGAVVISAAAMSERVQAVVPMSTQTYGTSLAPDVAPRALLLVHGTNDSILPDACSRQVYQVAQEPKELVLYPGAGHGLDECREELLDLLVRWIPEHLGCPSKT
ncbi:MAG TPA: dienelactone hydrolase family protein [Abditibacteriaceae bacterium]